MLVSRVGHDGIPLNPLALGSVARMRRADRGAWVRLDKRHPVEGVHPFPVDDDTRSTNVLTYPEHCTAAAAMAAIGDDTLTKGAST